MVSCGSPGIDHVESEQTDLPHVVTSP